MAPTLQTDSIPLHRRIGVARREGIYRVIAIEPIPAGALILSVEGVFVDAPSRYSIQVGETLHVEPPRELLPDLDPDRCPWRFLNHSCAPNAALGAALHPEGNPLTLIALRSIARWEEISFDYNSNEFDMAAPFACGCGACDGGLIGGFRHLDPLEQARRRSRVSPHVLARFERAG